jgi:hypothetical protein
MKTGIVFAIVTIAMLMVGCNPIYVNYDYDKDADFAKYQTFSWMELPEIVPQNPAQAQKSNPLLAKRIRSGVNDQLVSKGLKHLERGGDFLVIYYLDPKQMLLVQQNAYSGMDMWANSRVGGAITTKEITEGTMIIDLLDGQTKELVWRGMAENARRDDAPPEQLNKTIDDAIVKLFENYPPPKKN